MSERDFIDFPAIRTDPELGLAPGATSPPGTPGFHDVLSALNPLQYLPVVGNIYRALTGDIIPEPLRAAGSMIVSGLTGGPIGVGINVASIAFQKITGLDFDRMTHNVLAAIGVVAPLPGVVPAAPAIALAQANNNGTTPVASPAVAATASPVRPASIPALATPPALVAAAPIRPARPGAAWPAAQDASILSSPPANDAAFRAASDAYARTSDLAERRHKAA